MFYIYIYIYKIHIYVFGALFCFFPIWIFHKKATESLVSSWWYCWVVVGIGVEEQLKKDLWKPVFEGDLGTPYSFLFHLPSLPLLTLRSVQLPLPHVFTVILFYFPIVITKQPYHRNLEQNIFPYDCSWRETRLGLLAPSPGGSETAVPALVMPVPFSGLCLHQTLKWGICMCISTLIYF